MKNKKLIITYILLSLILLTTVAMAKNTLDNTKKLKYHANKKEKFIGAAVEAHQLLEEDFSTILKNEFNVITPKNSMKWERIHPQKDKYDFSDSDKIVEYAIKNKMKVRGHTLVWHNQNPTWLTDKNWTKEELLVILENHIKTVVGHYKGKVYAWDVVNEMIEGSGYRSSIWYDTIGPEYIELALK